MTNIVEAVVGTIGNILISSGRSVGGIEFDVTVEETGRDTTFITNHPVERGAAISDHAFMMPAELELRVGCSDSVGGYQGYSADVYAALLELQSAREPFEAVTGKRLYENMLVSAVEVTTNQESEHALFARIGLREVIIVDTQTTGGISANAVSPQRTSGTTSKGEQQLKASDISLPSWVAGSTPYL